MIKVFALIATDDVSSPCRLLFQLPGRTKNMDIGFLLGMFLLSSYLTCPAIEEARRRGFKVEILSQRRRYDPLLIARARKTAQKHEITILESHGYKPALLAWCLKRLTGLPWIAFAHGYTSGNSRIALYNKLDRWLLKRADRVVAVSNATGEILQDSGVPRDRIRVIHNAIDPMDYNIRAAGEEFRQECGVGPDNLLIGVIGRLSPEKGQSQFVRAFHELVRVIPEVQGVLVGEGQEHERLKSEIRELGLECRVRFAGYRENVSQVYAALDLVVIPSLSEGLPNVLLEAMLHRKALVASAIGGIPEVMRGELSKLLVPPNDVKALAQAMIQALQDASLRGELGEIGAKRILEAFSATQRVQQIIRLYEEVTAAQDG